MPEDHSPIHPTDAGAPGAASLAAPERRPVVGVWVSVTDYDRAAACILAAARNGRAHLTTALAVHGVVEGRRSPAMRRALGSFDIVTPDGQPVRHALNWLHGAGLADRVYGPTLMIRLCESAAEAGLSVYLYGSTADVMGDLAHNLRRRFPGLEIAGAEPSVFRPLAEAEAADLARRIRASGARLVFVGLGCPRQELFAWEQRDAIGLPLVCVGAAFDFHAGRKRQAPRWMQDMALEWLFRLGQEPRRLLRRYLVTNTVFVLALTRQLARRRPAAEE